MQLQNTGLISCSLRSKNNEAGSNFKLHQPKKQIIIPSTKLPVDIALYCSVTVCEVRMMLLFWLWIDRMVTSVIAVFGDIASAVSALFKTKSQGLEP